MRNLKIPFPDISTYEKTRLIASGLVTEKYVAGTSTLYLRNCAGFTAGDYIILDPFESEDAEVSRIQSVDRTAHTIDLYAPTYNNHLVGAVVMKTPYNQTKIYKGTTTTVTDHTFLVTLDLRPDDAYTYYVDEVGAATDYYSYTYFNSTRPYETSPRTLYVQPSYDCVTNVNDLKNNFLFGLESVFVDEYGYPFPTSMFEFGIRAACDKVSKLVGVKLWPTVIVDERQDYYIDDYRQFAFLQLNEYPILSVESVKIKYPATPDVSGTTTVTFPTSWYQINKIHGQIHMVPTYGTLSQMIIGQGGDYLSFLWRGWMGNTGYFPNLWAIDYTAGFECGQCPYDLVAVVSKMACFYPLTIAGDLVGGVGIGNKSLGIDGLSQGLGMTKSGEGGVFAGRLKQYSNEIKEEIAILVGYYKGLRMAVA